MKKKYFVSKTTDFKIQKSESLNYSNFERFCEETFFFSNFYFEAS